MGGSAILDAAEKLKAAIREAAARRLGLRAGGCFDRQRGDRGPGGKSLPWSALAGVSAEGTYASNKRTYSYGAHAAHVAVDPGTGHVALLDYVAVEDVGRIVNPLTLHGQSVGAIVQGLGGALLEQLIHDENGQLLTGSLADYLLPGAGDFPSDPRLRAGAQAGAAQSARRQGRGRGRHHSGRRRDRQRGGECAVVARCRAARAAAVAGEGVGVDSGGQCRPQSSVIARESGRSSSH